MLCPALVVLGQIKIGRALGGGRWWVAGVGSDKVRGLGRGGGNSGLRGRGRGRGGGRGCKECRPPRQWWRSDELRTPLVSVVAAPASRSLVARGRKAL